MQGGAGLQTGEASSELQVASLMSVALGTALVSVLGQTLVHGISAQS